MAAGRKLATGKPIGPPERSILFFCFYPHLIQRRVSMDRRSEVRNPICCNTAVRSQAERIGDSVIWSTPASEANSSCARSDIICVRTDVTTVTSATSTPSYHTLATHWSPDYHRKAEVIQMTDDAGLNEMRYFCIRQRHCL